MRGLGLALLPEIICHPELEQGLLEVVMPNWTSGTGEIQAVFASRRGMLPAIRVFINFLANHPPGTMTGGGGV